MNRVLACLSVCILLLTSLPVPAAAPPAKASGQGAAFLDLDKDGAIDILVTPLPGRQVGKGVVIADVDNDGFPDVYIVNGVLLPVRPVIDTIRIEGGKVKITGDSIEVEGGKIEITRRRR
jgi:hypothetical protein